jgi:hypothetical protein
MKIVQIGWVKTGSSSLHKALNLLDFYDQCGEDWNGEIAFRNLKELSNKTLIPFYIQWPWCQYQMAIKLYEKWDDVYFIYLKRDFEKQHGSRYRDFSGNPWGDENGPWTSQEFLERKNEVIDTWKEEEKHINNFLSEIPRDRWVEMNICDNGDGWEKLCSFLNVPIPAIFFPSTNEGGRG